MEQNNSFRNFSYIGIGRVTAIVLQAIFYLLFAALLGPESYGRLSVIIALAGTFSVFSRFGLSHTLQVYRAKKNSKLSDQVGTLFVISTSAAALILLTIDVFTAVLCIGVSFFSMNLANLLGLKKYKKYMLNLIVKSVLTIIIPVLLYFVLEIPGIVLGMAVGNFIGSVPYFRKLKITSFFDLKNKYKVIIHNFGVDASGTLPIMVDKLLIAPLFGFFIVGVYQFNLQIFYALGILPGILFHFLLSEESSGITHKKISYLVILGSIVAAATAIFLAPFFVNEFFPKYFEGIFSLQILVLSLIPAAISSIYNAKLMARESTRIGFSAIVRIGSLLALIMVLGQLYGLVGLSLAFLLSITINTVFLVFLYEKEKLHHEH